MVTVGNFVWGYFFVIIFVLWFFFLYFDFNSHFLLEKSTLSPPTTSKPKEIITEKPQCNCQCPNNVENILPGVHSTQKPDPPPQVDG